MTHLRTAIVVFMLGVLGCSSSDGGGAPASGGSAGTGTGGTGAAGGFGGNGALGGAAGDAGDTDGSGGGPADAAPDVPVGPATTAGDVIDIDGVGRSYFLHVPASAVTALQSGAPVPLLVGLHGAGDTGQNFVTATQLTNLATQNAFIIVAPDAYDGGGGRGWALDAAQGWPGDDGHTTSLPNDVGLVLGLIAELEKLYGIDTKRIFLCGFSRGAGLTGGLAALSNNKSVNVGIGDYETPFAAYAYAAGYNMFGDNGPLDLAAASPKRSIWSLHGTNDQGVPYSYGKAFADELTADGWDMQFDTIDGAPHNWLWQASFGHSNQELWDWFMDHAIQ